MDSDRGRQIERLGVYQIQERIGAGGMGEVYRARDTRLGRDVAIKILPSAFTADPDRLARFEREARVLASLNHPNIATIHGVEEGEGIPALVMELVEGETLAERITRGPLRIADALSIATQITEALDAAHEKGIVHRDLKPANIKITPNGIVKVLDFGLAKAAEGDAAGPDLTQSPTITAMGTRAGVILGTAAYMSPEQARGQTVDKRTDIWAFGCVLYEMLTARAASSGATLSDTIVAILERQPDWAALPAETPPALRRVLQRCLEKDAKRRLRDIGDARMELEAVSQPSAQPVALRRRRLPLWAAAVVSAVAAGVAAWQLRPAPDAVPDNPLSNAQFTRLTDFPGTEMDAALSADGAFVAFLADRDGSFDIWLHQVGTGRFVNLTTAGSAPPRNAVRNVGFSPDGEVLIGGTPAGGRMALMPLIGGAPRPFLGATTINAAWSPDGSSLVYHTRDDGDPMFIADRTGANPRQIFVDRAGVHNHFPVWATDGRWVYFVHGIFDTYEMDIWRISPSGGMPERITELNADISYPTPIDARTLLYIARAGDRSGPWLWALDVETRLTRRISLGLEKYMSIAASGNGRRLVATVANPTASLWSVPIGDRIAAESDVRAWPVPTVRALMPRFGGGSLFYLSSRGTGDGVWRAGTGEATEVWRDPEGALMTPPAVARDGQRVGVVVRRQGQLRLAIVSADDTEPRTLTEGINVRGSADWSPDGKWIVTGGSDSAGPGLFKIPVDGGAPVRLATGPALNPAWSPDGNLIVYTGLNVALHGPLRGVRPDGTPVALPELLMRNEGERYRFLPNGAGLVYMQGFAASQDFWLLDLATQRTRQLTRLDEQGAMRTFDITPDGTRIVFDRLRDNSDIVLIDLERRESVTTTEP